MPSHLVNISAYDFDLERLGGEQGVRDLVSSRGLAGVEMLTGHFPAPKHLKDIVAGVHLPYAVDWYSGWLGQHDLDAMDDEMVPFFCYGRDREGMVSTVEAMIRHASALEPSYGVFHGASPNINTVFSQDNGHSDDAVLNALAELLNSAIAGFPGGEPPFTIALENLWWPGLRLLHAREVEILERRLEFDDWAICLDTGHLMNALRDCREELPAAESVNRVLDTLGDKALDRINSMHLHMSLSADYQLGCMQEGESQEYSMADLQGKLSIAYPHFGKMDWHAPFGTDSCRDIVSKVSPEFITHEFISPEMQGLIERLDLQLSHFR